VRPLLEQSYYEILEVKPSVDAGALQRAYTIARATYQPDSAATYSIFSDEDTGAILRRIEEAYQVLSDAEKRATYDRRLSEQQRAEEPPPAPHEPGDPAPVPRASGTPGLAPPLRRPLPAPVIASTRVVDRRPRVLVEAPEEFAMLIESTAPKETGSNANLADGLDPEDGIYDGAVLRRIRMSLGIELSEVAVRSKISLEHLHSIEEDRFDALPPPVYVRGFVREMARCLGLDPAAVSKSYHDMMTASRSVRR
jgi:flagellar biosynthesis protein FlhG